MHRLPEAGFRPGVAPWLGGADTQYTRVAHGWVTTIVLACYGPWIVLHGRAGHAAHWPYTHHPVTIDRRDLAPEQAIRFALTLDPERAGEAEGAREWPEEDSAGD